MRKITLLPFLIIILSGCASSSHGVFYVTDADFYARSKFGIVDSFIQSSSRKEIVYSAHRIEHGLGTVIALRSFSSGRRLLVDQASFRKMTIYVAGPLDSVLGRTISIDSQDAVAFLSSSSSTSPGSNGCFGFANSGVVHVEQNNALELIVSVDLNFDQESPLGWDGECEKLRVTEKRLAEKQEFTTLTPWQGKAGKAMSDETVD